MNEAQRTALDFIYLPRPVINVADLDDKSPRTLLYGSFVNGITSHVYLGDDGLIHRMPYAEIDDAEPLVLSHLAGPGGRCMENRDFVSNKRLYAESCDFEFCRLLRLAGVYPIFTIFDADKGAKRLAQHAPFAAPTFEQLEHRQTIFLSFDPRSVASASMSAAFAASGAEGLVVEDGVYVLASQAHLVFAKENELLAQQGQLARAVQGT